MALTALQRDKTLAEFVKQFDAQVIQNHDRRRRLLDKAVELFGRGDRRKEETVKELHARIGQFNQEATH